MIGVLVMNVATCAAVAEAVVEGAPLTHRAVTVTGEAIAKPGNFYVPIGTACRKAYRSLRRRYSKIRKSNYGRTYDGNRDC